MSRDLSRGIEPGNRIAVVGHSRLALVRVGSLDCTQPLSSDSVRASQVLYPQY